MRRVNTSIQSVTVRVMKYNSPVDALRDMGLRCADLLVFSQAGHLNWGYDNQPLKKISILMNFKISTICDHNLPVMKRRYILGKNSLIACPEKVGIL